VRSWKTSVAGILAILAAIVGVLQTGLGEAGWSAVDWNVALAAISVGVGMLFARDNDKNSEAVGANT